MSANYAIWYLVEVNGKMEICKTETARDEYISAMCRKIADMQVPNSDRPKITIRIDCHVRPNGHLM